MPEPQPTPLERALAEYAALLVQHEATQTEAQHHAEKFRFLEARLTNNEDRQDEVFKRLAEEAAKAPTGPTLYTACGLIFRIAGGRAERLHAKDVSPLPF